jgi:error-prone DNA polymerase
MPIGEEVVEDYASLKLSLKRHPLALLRRSLDRQGLMPASGLADLGPGRWVRVAGLVLVRQRPGTASGIVFITLEDETGVVNLVVYADVFERYRRAILGARLLAAWGSVDRDGMVIHVKARRFVDLSAELDRLADPDAADPDRAEQGPVEPGLQPALARADHGSPPRPRVLLSRDGNAGASEPPPALLHRQTAHRLKAPSRDFH